MKFILWNFLLRLKYPSCSIQKAQIAKCVNLENNVTIKSGCVVGSEIIGKYTFINHYCLIDKNVKSIGRFCSIAYNVRIGLGNHPTEWVSTHPFAYDKKYGFLKESISFENKSYDTVIGNDVWIGANATILAGVKVGDGAIIGANSLVKEDVEPYSIVVGSPAKQVKKRFNEETIAKLTALKWWDWSEEKIKEKIDLFKSPESLFSD